MNSWDDWAYDMAMQDKYEEELFEENVEAFTTDRLQSYFIAHPNLAERAERALDSSKALLAHDSTAALLFAGVAQELLFRDVIIKPVVYGLVANESAANLITSHAVGSGSPTKLKSLILELLKDSCGVDLMSYSRKGSPRPLWEEVTLVVQQRNRAVHQGERFTSAEANEAIAIADAVFQDVFSATVTAVGLHLHGSSVCGADHAPKALARASGRGPV